MHREQRAVLGRGAEHVGEPGQLLGPQLAVVVARDAGVEGDDAQAVDVVHPVLEAVVVGVEEPLGIRAALVVVAHRPDHDRAHRGRGRLDDRAERRVGVGLGLVGEVAGEDQRLRSRAHLGEAGEGGAQVGDVVDHAVVQPAAADQVRVGEVGDGVPRGGVLAELFHADSLGVDASGQQGLARRSPARRAAVGSGAYRPQRGGPGTRRQRARPARRTGRGDHPAERRRRGRRRPPAPARLGRRPDGRPGRRARRPRHARLGVAAPVPRLRAGRRRRASPRCSPGSASPPSPWSLPLLLAPPLFSRDGWSYAAQGTLAHRGISPYEYGPWSLVGPRSVPGPIVEGVDARWMATPAPYGPVPLIGGDLAAGLTSDPWLLVVAHRLIALAGLVLLAWAVPRLARWCGANPALASCLVLASPLMVVQRRGRAPQRPADARPDGRGARRGARARLGGRRRPRRSRRRREAPRRPGLRRRRAGTLPAAASVATRVRHTLRVRRVAVAALVLPGVVVGPRHRLARRPGGARHREHPAVAAHPRRRLARPGRPARWAQARPTRPSWTWSGCSPRSASSASSAGCCSGCPPATAASRCARSPW